MSYSPFFLSGFQHTASLCSQDEPSRQRSGSLPDITSTRSVHQRSKISRQRSLSCMNSTKSSVPPSTALPPIPSSPTPSSILLPKDSNLPSTSLTAAISSRHTFPLSILRSNSTVTSSTVSTRHRRTKRSDALARLEGRSSQWYSKGRESWLRTRPSQKKPYNDFMSMSDDSDAEDENDDSFIDIGLEFDVGSTRVHEQRSTTFRLTSAPKRRAPKLLPSLSTPLHSFIDLADQDARVRTESHTGKRRSWRGMSFIEISSL